MSQGLTQVVKYHVFCCTTERPPTHPKPSCGARGSGDLINYFWERVMALNLFDDVRAGTSACLGMCNAGPVMVVYPQGAWYHYESKGDIDEIIQTHFVEGKFVDRLLINRA